MHILGAEEKTKPCAETMSDMLGRESREGSELASKMIPGLEKINLDALAIARRDINRSFARRVLVQMKEHLTLRLKAARTHQREVDAKQFPEHCDALNADIERKVDELQALDIAIKELAS